MRIPGVTLLMLFILSFICDFYIWSDIRQYCREKKIWGKVYAVSAILCWIFLIVTVCLPRRSDDSDILPVMWMLYSYISVYFSKFTYVVISLLGRIPRIWKGKRVNTGLWLGVPLALLVFGVMWWGALVTRNEVEVTKVTIESEKIPQAFDNYRIVQFSDAHVGTWGDDTSFIRTLVDTINSLHPDLIVFTGDIVNRTTPELEPFLSIFSKLHAKDGVLSILGNHDYGDYIDWKSPSEKAATRELLQAWERQMGWKLLNNVHTFIVKCNDTLPVIGVENWGEPPFKQYGKLEKAYPETGHYNLNDSLFKILLSHNPEHWRQEVSKNSNIDLTLSGHTHGMQFMIKMFGKKWSPAEYKYPQWAGMYEVEGPDGNPSKLYVNIGCGEVGLPFRIGAKPEVTLFTLVSSKPVK